MAALKIILIALGVILLYQVLIRLIRKLYHFPAPAIVGRFLDSDLKRRLIITEHLKSEHASGELS